METLIELEKDFKQLAAAELAPESNGPSMSTRGAAYSFCS